MITNARALLSLPLAAALFAASAALAAAPADAEILEGGPVAIDACSVTPDGDVAVSYHNRRPIAATRVVFYVGYRGQQRRVVDVGTFTQGAEIQHTFEKALIFRGPTPNMCTVTSVQFVDGRTWYH